MSRRFARNSAMRTQTCSPTTARGLVVLRVAVRPLPDQGRRAYAKCFATICSIVPIVRIVCGPSGPKAAVVSSGDSLRPPLGSQ